MAQVAVVAMTCRVPCPLETLAGTARGPVGSQSVTVTDTDNGRTVRVAVGGNLIVRLAANPSTGYQWKAVGRIAACLQAAGSPEYEGPPTSRPGAGGAQVFLYRAVRPCRIQLLFQYRRPWEGWPIKSYTINVLVPR
jgi:inhibitor of cysteine peptidase